MSEMGNDKKQSKICFLVEVAKLNLKIPDNSLPCNDHHIIFSTAVYIF